MDSIYAAVDQATLEKESCIVPLKVETSPEALGVGAGTLIHECPGLGEENLVIQCTYQKKIYVSGNSISNKIVKQPKESLPIQPERDDESKTENKAKYGIAAMPRYLNIEPSLAMDWLEISWDELQIKERVGAGILSLHFFFLLHFFKKHMNPMYL